MFNYPPHSPPTNPPSPPTHPPTPSPTPNPSPPPNHQAQTAYGRAGQHEASIRVLQALAHNAVLERRYADAGLQLWRLASATLLRQASQLGDGADLGPARDAFDQARRKADFYFAYSSIYKYTDEPFTALTPEVRVQRRGGCVS